jgi:hypothetical protein
MLMLAPSLEPTDALLGVQRTWAGILILGWAGTQRPSVNGAITLRDDRTISYSSAGPLPHLGRAIRWLWF